MLFWVPPERLAEHHESNSDKREEICSGIDDNGFDWQIWAVASSGFFTDSYNLFATNVILPSLAFVYWGNDSLSVAVDHETAINIITLAGSLVGQLLFGFLADRFGRKRLYGVELVVVIFGTIGFVQCSSGYNGSMNVLSWILFWRFIVGLGIGAEYPLSAVITAEFAPRQSRGRMMAAVFLMQPLGQLLASVVGLVVLVTYGYNAGLDTDPLQLDQQTIVDTIWRYVIGVGAIPAFVAIIFRLTIPESPRYTLDVDHDGVRALEDTRQYLKIAQVAAAKRQSAMVQTAHNDDVENDAADVPENAEFPQTLPRVVRPHDTLRDDDDDEDSTREIQDLGRGDASDDEDEEERVALPDPFSWAEIKQFFITEGNGKYLLGTSMCWFLLDFAFYGLGINNPRVISAIWSSQSITSTANTPSWGNPSDPGLPIYETLKQDAIRYIITISAGSLLGSLIVIKLINYVPRKAWLAWSFVVLAVLFAIAGGSYVVAANSDLHALTILLYALAQLFFNLGPNTLTFILPAEIFPTRYRGTCHGISAASGKLGSIIVQAFLPKINISGANSISLSWVLLGFSGAMALGAVVAWAWIPEVQNPRGSEPEDDRGSSRRRGLKRYEVPNKSLEELAVGRIAVEDEKMKVGFRHRGKLLTNRMDNAIRRRRKA